jgi:hypothetical protein
MRSPFRSPLRSPLRSAFLDQEGVEVQAFAFQSETSTLTAHANFGTAPSTNRKRTIDRAIRRLKAAGIWDKARWLQFIGATEAASMVNWKTPSETCTKVGTPTYTADQHWVSASSGNYLNTGINASVLAQNDLGFFVWCHTGHMAGVAQGSASILGAINASSQGISICPRTASDGMTYRCAGTSISSAVNVTNGFGLHGVVRSDSANITSFKNKIQRTTSANTSVAPPALAIHLLGLNNNGSGGGGNNIPQAFWYFGQALTAAEVALLTAAVGEYLESIRYGEYYCEEPGIGTAAISADCVAYGLTGQSVCFALQAARAGRTVAIIGGWRDRYTFGMAGGGLGFTDFDTTSLGGLPRLLITRCNTFAGVSDDHVASGIAVFKFQPKFFNRACKELLDPTKNGGFDIPVYLSEGVSSVTKVGLAIASIRTADGRTITGSQWHDGSYEGDLIRHVPGLSWTKGREAAGSGGEANNGVEAIANATQPLDGLGNVITVDPWITPATPASGLLPGFHFVSSTFSPEIHTYPVAGTADTKPPAYNFRLTFTNSALLRIALPSTPPTGFDIARYETLLRQMDAATIAGNALALANILKLDDLRTSGTHDINNSGYFSTDLVGGNWDYPTASYAARETIWQDHWNYILGFWYVLQYHVDARVPASLRTSALTYGFADDHFYSPHENDVLFGSQPQLYVRESVRLVGDVVMNATHMNQTDGQAPTLGNKTISVAAYDMDSHAVNRVAHETSAGVWQSRSDGGMLVAAGGVNNDSPLPYEIAVPKVAECTNLSVSFGMSTTHVSYGSTRMEPTAMQTAQSMGHAAALAVAGAITIQAVDYTTLRTALLASAALTGEVAPVLPQTT